MIYDVMLDCSVRLYGVLMKYCFMFKSNDETWKDYAQRTPATMVLISKLNEMRNCGIGSIQEFIRLRNALV